VPVITVRDTTFRVNRLRPILKCWRQVSCPRIQPTTLKLHFGRFRIIKRVVSMKQTMHDIHVEIKSRIAKAKAASKKQKTF
jgi:hypothetical protein